MKAQHPHEGVRHPVGCTYQTPQPSDDTMSCFLQLNNTLSLGQHRVWKRMTVKWAGAKPGDAALDVCCGSGDLAFVLAEAVGPSGKVSRICLRSLQIYRPKVIAASAFLD